MNFNEWLDDSLKRYEITNKEVSNYCCKRGVAVTSSYIAMLRRSNSKRYPSDKLSRLLELMLHLPDNAISIICVLEKNPILENCVRYSWVESLSHTSGFEKNTPCEILQIVDSMSLYNYIFACSDCLLNL